MYDVVTLRFLSLWYQVLWEAKIEEQSSEWCLTPWFTVSGFLVPWSNGENSIVRHFMGWFMMKVKLEAHLNCSIVLCRLKLINYIYSIAFHRLFSLIFLSSSFMNTRSDFLYLISIWLYNDYLSEPVFRCWCCKPYVNNTHVLLCSIRCCILYFDEQGF